MTDQADIQTRVIGLLTAAHNTVGKDPYALDDLVELMGPLLDGFGPSSFEVQVATDQSLENVTKSVVIQVLDRVRPTVQTITATFIAAFIGLCHEYESECPEANVEELLQRLGLIVQQGE